MKHEYSELQREQLGRILSTNKYIGRVVEIAEQLKLPNYYLGGGSIVQTVWNHFHTFEPTAHIKDYDLVYFDTDTTNEAQDRYIRAAKNLSSPLNIDLEITNQARVHLWYEEHFGQPTQPYASTEEGMNTWPTVATITGVRKDGNNLKVYAPYGMDDLFNMIVRPNKLLITKEIYEKKIERWVKTWPRLTVIPW